MECYDPCAAGEVPCYDPIMNQIYKNVEFITSGTCNVNFDSEECKDIFNNNGYNVKWVDSRVWYPSFPNGCYAGNFPHGQVYGTDVVQKFGVNAYSGHWGDCGSGDIRAGYMRYGLTNVKCACKIELPPVCASGPVGSKCRCHGATSGELCEVGESCNVGVCS